MLRSFSLNAISEISHFVKYATKRSRSKFEKGMLIVSTDIDVGNPQLGVLNKGKRDRDVNLHLSEYDIGKIEEISIPLFVKTFDEFGVPMTLAVRGQLTEVGGKVLDCLLESCVKHDIGAHGYYHSMFTEITPAEAEAELTKISAGMSKYGLIPKTFIFPRNCIAHLNLLEKHNYFCYRSRGGFSKDCMKIEKTGQLYNIHPSIYVDRSSNPLLLKKILDISIRTRLPFHIWLHFWNFGNDENSVEKTLQDIFVPFLHYAKEKKEQGLLECETMLSASQKACSTYAY